jgi:hypothetical protein
MLTWQSVRVLRAVQVVGLLCLREDRAALQVMAQLLGSPSAAHLCIDRGQQAIAHVLWRGTQAQKAFASFAKQVRQCGWHVCGAGAWATPTDMR